MKAGWEIKTLGDLAAKITDGSHNPPKGVEKSEYLMLSSQNVWNGYLDKSIARHLSKQDFLVEDKRTCAREGDVLLTIVGTIGRTCVLSREDTNITFQRSVCIIKPKPELNPFFLSYQLQFKNKEINEQANGAAQKGFYLKQVERLPLFITSLTEQQRIVDILDQEFAKIDALKANAEKSLQAAKDLFQATLKKELEPKEGWKAACLDDICKIVGRIGFRGYTRNDIVASPADGAISLSPSNIVDGEMKYDKLTYISWFKYDESPEIKIYNGDILLVKTGSSYGKSAVIKDLPHEATINPQLVVLKDIKIDTQYLHFYLSTDIARKKFDEFVSGTAIPTFSQRNLGQMVICFPNPEMTKEIVAKLNNLRERLTAFQDNYQKTLALCDDLKQALLRKAFNGEL